MRRIHLLIAIILTIILVANGNLCAQSSIDFALSPKGSHLYFGADIAGKQADIMLESAIPAFLIDRDFYEQVLSKTDLQFEPSSAKITLMHEKYNISFKASGKLKVGNAIYDGPIFILDDFGDFRIPIQNLRNQHGDIVPIGIDLKKGLLSVGVSAANTNAGKSYKMKTDKSLGFLTVTSPMEIQSAGKYCKMKGDFAIDFGNPMLLFLMKQHKSLAKAIEKGEITLTDAHNKEGVVIAQGIYANEMTICGRTYKDSSIGVTDKMPSIKQLGLLGIPFYGSLTVFDFAKSRMTVFE